MVRANQRENFLKGDFIVSGPHWLRHKAGIRGGIRVGIRGGDRASRRPSRRLAQPKSSFQAALRVL
ncbi:hypothetical protein F9K88_04830 [Brucella intermedia]|uniref:Uncharacterized protein n=1 Tax=Brucella intermedia TaxID=94625 RepID=A0A7V6U073_9HYPH|nr:hypothetical protein F9K88_04830 [Brucella intermedia]PJR94925.1 hypothetical protein CN881_00895 [Ochrobactrum sp. 721/2009]PJT18025.1 hypothetical protein CN880_02360 [Ochrobactrum sp. 720/2009]PJT22001.1 hypothetical protein CN879_11890 [Ochrobactrum sp. 715/2009]PJT27432.1 hypothetical protein CN884_03310 [Ochrobactrum sp. 30A/1000/2015]PJT31560.1 hypothetical protein CN878_05630 [Ochrobactrum sp. 695/2009]PJT33458.1 hypothetical protein CN877_15565 [Ochrobactrum sp. 689/2009]PJT38974